MNHRGGVVIGIHTAKRVKDNAFAQKTLRITASHAFIDSRFEIPADNVYILSDCAENDSHARILTNGNLQFIRRLHIFAHITKNTFGKRISFSLRIFRNTLLQTAGQIYIRFYNSITDGCCDLFAMDLSQE